MVWSGVNKGKVTWGGKPIWGIRFPWFPALLRHFSLWNQPQCPETAPNQPQNYETAPKKLNLKQPQISKPHGFEPHGSPKLPTAKTAPRRGVNGSERRFFYTFEHCEQDETHHTIVTPPQHHLFSQSTRSNSLPC